MTCLFLDNSKLVFDSSLNRRIRKGIKMGPTDRELLRILQSGLPLVPRPFTEVATKLGMGEGEVLSRIKTLLDKGVIRRFGVVVHHRKAGITANAMVVWKVPQAKVEKVGRRMAQFKEATHCYERRIIPGKWEYNVFCMIHGYSKKHCEEVVRRISEVTGIKDYMVLFSEREFKKTSLKIP